VTTKKGRQLLRGRKVHPRQNPGYAYDSVKCDPATPRLNWKNKCNCSDCKSISVIQGMTLPACWLVGNGRACAAFRRLPAPLPYLLAPV